MKRPVALWFGLLFLLLSALPGASSARSSWQASPQKDKGLKEDRPRAGGQTAITIKVDQVRLDVTVTDKDGNLVTGLQPEHFKVFEDKVEQKITNFLPIEAPVTVVLLVEYNKVIWPMLYEVWNATYVFVDSLRKDDLAAVIAFDIKPEILTDFTDSKSELYNALRRLNYPAWSESNMYDAMVDTLDRIEEVDQRTAVVLIGTGLDTFSKINLDQLLKKVKATDAPIYCISVGGNLRARYEHQLEATARMDFYQADNVLKTMAKYTGGQAFFPRFISEFPPICRDITNYLRHQYSVSYVSTNTERNGKFRKLKVDVVADLDGDSKPDKLIPRFREGYTAESN